MTETIDQLIQARFDAIANPLHDANWNDVLARAGRVDRRRRGPARIALAAAVVVVAATITAVALGWPGTVIDFFKAPPAPESVKAFFAGHNSPFPSGVNPETRLGQPRQVMTATFDANHLPPTHPTLHTLYVAPRTGGGFCFVWTMDGGSCADPEDPVKARTDPAARPTGLTWLENDYVGVVDGWVRGDAKTVVAHFADGTTATIPITWVSAPVDAGFFAYVVPPAHLTRADALTAIVALDADGTVVSRQPFELTKPLDEDVLQTLPDGTKYSLPRRAQAARAREPFSFRTTSGAHAYLWVMPRTGGGSCYLFGTGAGGGFGCWTPRELSQIPAINGGVYGNGSFYFAQVRSGIARVELRYANGRIERLTPVDGYLLHQIPPAYRKADARLVATVGLSRSGRRVFTQRLETRFRCVTPGLLGLSSACPTKHRP
jgi:hypothetical protein